MKKRLLFTSLVALILSLTGCGEKETVQPNSQPVTQVQANAPSEPALSPTEIYVQELNSMKIKYKLGLIGTYGEMISKFDKTNKNDIKGVREADEAMILEYGKILISLGSMNVPEEYKVFNSLLQNTISNFIASMKEMDLYLADVNKIDHLQKSSNHFISSAKSYEKLTKELPFAELK